MKSFADKLREEGMEKGMEKGMERNRLDTVRNLLLLGVEESKIIQATKISPETFEEIKQSLQD